MQNDTRWAVLEQLAVSDVGGDKLFDLITTALAIAFKVRWVGFGLLGRDGMIDIVSFRDRNADGFADPFSFKMAGSPCAELYKEQPYRGEAFHLFVTEDLTGNFPDCPLIADIGAEAYLGEVIFDRNKIPIAHVLLMDDRPFKLDNQEVEFFRLIGQRAGAELRRYRAEQRVQQVTVERERVMAGICHDISQTPLAAQLLVMSLKSKSPTDEQRMILDQLSTTLSSLNDLLEELRAHFAANSRPNGAGPVMAPVEIPTLFEQLRSKFTPIAKHKGLNLTFFDLDVSINSDALALRAILGNLIANAISYTIEGQVVVSCWPERDDLVIEVSDTGIGIHEDDLASVFESYYRGRNADEASSEHPGYGLGLNIVKRKADEIGARVTVESDPGEGTLFRIEIPLT